MNWNRTGIFTSSAIYKLMSTGRDGKSFGSPALTYIRDKQYEIQLGRPLASDQFAYPTSWGTVMERYAYELLPMSWELVSDQRWEHDALPWHGSPDLIHDTAIGDIKSPWTLGSFMQMIGSLSVDQYKANFPEYYWQLVSNAILTNRTEATAVVFVPTLSQLNDIRLDLEDDPDFGWIADKPIDSLPYLPDNCRVEPITEWTFRVPNEDIDRLYDAVSRASALLMSEFGKSGV